MLSKRIIPCLDVKNGLVIKGTQFLDHKVVGNVEDLAKLYQDSDCDELVFYDITASVEKRLVDSSWIKKIARILSIPFCVAGGIRSVADAKQILNAGADKISINTPACENPNLITELAENFGSQCVVIGIDSRMINNQFICYSNTGNPEKMSDSGKETFQWIKEVQDRGAGEIVLNCMNQDGTRDGYDLAQLNKAREICEVPLIASGGAGTMQHFYDVFHTSHVDGALAAGVFHRKEIGIPELKNFLRKKNIPIR